MTGPETLAKVLEEHEKCGPKAICEDCYEDEDGCGFCAECQQPFPCLTRRLAETVQELQASGVRFVDACDGSPGAVETVDAYNGLRAALKLERLV